PYPCTWAKRTQQSTSYHSRALCHSHSIYTSALLLLYSSRRVEKRTSMDFEEIGFRTLHHNYHGRSSYNTCDSATRLGSYLTVMLFSPRVRVFSYSLLVSRNRQE
ncbi:unnamed protein product, partial [Ectocarpus sp. 13 AM-2016]